MRGVLQRDRLPVVLVFALALVARLWLLVHTERLDVVQDYDPATYYTAAAALLHGRLPYHGDFTFMHPPGIILAGLPSASLGSLTTARTGYVAAHAMCCVLGALTCAGVIVIARQWGLDRWSAVVGGAFLAVWPVSVVTQSVFRLEPIGDVLFVAALLALGSGKDVSRRRLVLAGVVLGVLVNVKVWWFLPVLVLLVLTTARVRSWAVPLVTTGAAAATAVVIDLPFLLAPGSRMFHSVITAQLGRPPVQMTPAGVLERMPLLARLDEVTGVAVTAQRFLTPAQAFTDTRVHVGTVIVCGLFVAAAALALRTRLGRLAVPLVVAQTAAMLTVPVFFGFYSDFVGVAAALVLAAAVSVLPAPGRRAACVIPVAATVALVLVLTGPGTSTGTPPAVADRVKAVVGDARCVVGDSPAALIEIDAVDRSLAPGCRNYVDIQGVGHGAGPDPRARYAGSASAERAWRREVRRYLGSGDVLVLSTPVIGGALGQRTVANLVRGRPATRVGGVVVYGPRPVR